MIDGRGVGAPVLAITFDDGPSEETTPLILDTLRSHDARATFFVLGKHAAEHPELVRRIAREGHEIGNHGWSHGILVFASRRQIAREFMKLGHLLDRLGLPPARVVRVPHGFRNPFVNRVATGFGYRVAGWSAGVFDTAKPGSDVIARRAISALHPGCVLLLHDADGNGDDHRRQTAEALPAILEAATRRGLRTVGMSEIVALTPQRRAARVRSIAAALLAAAVVTVAFIRIDRSAITDTLEVFRSISVSLVVAALVANVLSVIFKAGVWKAALDSLPGGIPVRYRQVLPATFIGFLLNTVLVARIGEVGRVVVLRRRLLFDRGTAPSSPEVAATLVAEQVVLGATLLGILVGTALTVTNLPKQLVTAVLAFAAVIAGLVLVIVLVEVLARSRRAKGTSGPPRGGSISAWSRFRHNAGAVLTAASRGQRLFRNRRRAVFAIAAGTASWAAQMAGIWLTIVAFGFDEHRLGATAVVFLASNVVGLIQVTPGNVGVFQFAVAGALTSTYGISQASALSFAIGLQVIEVAVGAGIGLVFLSIEGLSIGDLRRSISRAESESAGDIWAPPPLVAERSRLQGT